MDADSDLQRERLARRAASRSLVVALSVAFYLAVIPVAVLYSGPVYRALQCTFGDCAPAGTSVAFVLPSRGALRVGSAVRLPNGDPIGRVVGFQASGDERYTTVLGRLSPDVTGLLDSPLRCEAVANFNLEMDADLVVSTCPGLGLTATEPGQPLICGSADHFERMGQELRRFVLENVRPGQDPPGAARLSGPCGADNEALTSSLRRLLSR